MYVCVHVHICAYAHGSQKRASELLELQESVNYLMWVLGTKLGSFARAENVLTLATSLVLFSIVFILGRDWKHLLLILGTRSLSASLSL